MDIGAENNYPVPLANSTALLSMLMLSLARQKHSPDTSSTFKNEYDYIIVGAGSAGSVLANRLSEIPCVSVLVLEAGKPPPILTEVPAYGRFFWFTDIDWQYKTAPQRYTGSGLINRQVVWPSGKTLGGSSVLNAQLYVRGSRKIFDRWAAEGAEGWSYKDVLPYFKKLEDNRDPEYIANGFHGVHGPQTAHRPRYKAEFKDPLVKAAQSLGYHVIDPNAYNQVGFYDLQGTLRAGQRCSTAKAYLVPAENRTNLDILPNAMVRKVLIQDRRAVGVQFDYQGSTFEVRANQEVILSAGTINSAQLLMLSGIGPRKELERHKIPVIANLPVGLNLQDHPGVPTAFVFGPEIPKLEDKLLNPANTMQYIQNRTGPLASTEFCSLLAFLKNNDSVPHEDPPDHELYLLEGSPLLFAQIGVTPEYFAQVVGPYVGRPIWACSSSLLHPRSRGTVTLNSADPYDPPIIDPNYFEDPRDIHDMVEGLKTCMRIGTHPQLQRVGSVPFQTVVPGCEKYVGNEDAYFECSTRTAVFTWNHQVGTVRMGHPKDPRTVVDPQLRVLHIHGLRVIDASVMPYVPTGNTNAATIMVAEKASDIIKASISCHNKHEGPWKKHGEDSWDKPNNFLDKHTDVQYQKENSFVEDVPIFRPEFDSQHRSFLNEPKNSQNKHRVTQNKQKDPYVQDDPVFRPEFEYQDRGFLNNHKNNKKKHRVLQNKQNNPFVQNDPLFRSEFESQDRSFLNNFKDSHDKRKASRDKQSDAFVQNDSLFRPGFDTEDIIAEED